jgi:hypothetical protein
MIVRLSIAAFLLAHAAIHAGFVSARPPATAGGPPWPFELSRSWLLTPLGVDAERARLLGVALVALTIASFALAALAAIGLVPSGVWTAAVTAGAVASIALLAIYMHPWLILGVAIDLALLWVALVGSWTPDRLSG